MELSRGKRKGEHEVVRLDEASNKRNVFSMKNVHTTPQRQVKMDLEEQF
jgi:hypothetical protein